LIGKEWKAASISLNIRMIENVRPLFSHRWTKKKVLNKQAIRKTLIALISSNLLWVSKNNRNRSKELLR
jgi:hypothetical protein